MASSSAAAAASAPPPLTWRHYVHLVVESASSGRVVLPLVLTLHADDAAALSGAALPAVLADILFILRLHAPRILPGQPDAAAGAAGPAAGGAGAGAEAGGVAVAVYHGDLVSATFSLREADAAYAVLLIPPAPAPAPAQAPAQAQAQAQATATATATAQEVAATGAAASAGAGTSWRAVGFAGSGDGGGGGGGADGGGWQSLPLAAFTLCATLRHKASERRRRKERLLTSPSKLDAYLLSGGSRA